MSWTNRNLILAVLPWFLLLNYPSSVLASTFTSSDNSNDYAVPASPPEKVSNLKSPYTELLLEIDINDQELNQIVVVIVDMTGHFYLKKEDLLSWRFREPSRKTGIKYQDSTYYPLSAIVGESHIYDEHNLSLKIHVQADAFNLTVRSSIYPNLPSPVKSNPGGFLNYDLFTVNSLDYVQHSGQFEFGYFNENGVLTGNILAENYGTNTSAIRLDTTWSQDIPEDMRTLRLGDVISTPGTWGRSVRFGGIQFGTNFATQPGFRTYPMQSAVGQAVMPSTVDVFINNALVSRQIVPPGPFAISNLPVVTGAGQVNLMVRDLFGRELIINQPFYASQSLLSKGLENYSYELGFIRDNFGINSNDYHNWLASENYRRGLSNDLTGEVHIEIMQGQQSLGIGGDYLVPQIGTISSYIAASHKKISDPYIATIEMPNSELNTYKITNKESPLGTLIMLGVDRLAQPWSMGVRSQWASSGFTEVGQVATQFSPTNQITSNLSYTTSKFGSFGAAYISQINRDIPSSRIVTIGYSVTLGRMGAISLSALRDLATLDAGTTFFTMLSIPLGGPTSASFSSQSKRGANNGNGNEFASTIQRNIPSGDGYGYFLQTRSDGTSQATYTLQNNIGTYTASIAQNSGLTSTSLDINGGIAALGNDVFLSRRLDQSFAVARIPDFSNLTVLTDNQPVAKTDINGNALIPRLRAYDRNEISIDPAGLPLDAKILATKVTAVPYYRSGIEVRFPITHSRGATFTIHLEDGKPMQTGAKVKINSNEQVFTVGYGGEVYAVDLKNINKVHVNWNHQNCDFEVNFKKTSDPLQDLGTFICREVRQ